MDIGIGDFVEINKGATIVSGVVDGIKVNESGLERISILEIDYWFWMDAGWRFITDTEEEEQNGEI